MKNETKTTAKNGHEYGDTTWYDADGGQHGVEELAIGVLTALYGHDRRNFFFAKTEKRVTWRGADAGSVFVERVA